MIGRIGESGAPFYVGDFRHHVAYTSDDEGETGKLYLRIDDDLLGDNTGYVTVRIEITEPQ